MADETVRNLADAPDYSVDWRHLVVQGYLSDVMIAENNRTRMVAILDIERDPFVRQLLKFRYDGNAANAEGFRYATGCQARNSVTGAASMIKAMLIADRTPEEIAIELGTKTMNVVTYAKIFFEVRRYLNNESWLRQIVFAEPAKDRTEAAFPLERRWLAAAFHRGWAGVEQIVFHRAPSTTAEVEALTTQLQATLTSRALEFAMELETSGTAPTSADLDRFLAARNAQSRQPPVASDNTRTALAFIRGLHGDIERRADENPDDPTLAPFRELKAARQTAPSPARQRIRTRFAGS